MKLSPLRDIQRALSEKPSFQRPAARMRHILFVSVFTSVFVSVFAFVFSFVFALVFALVFVCGLTSAASAAEPPTDRRAALMVQAQQALQAGREEEALRAWRDAWSLGPSYEIACNIGRIALRLDDAREAAEYLSRCTRLAPEATTKAEKERQRKLSQDLEAARKKVASLRVIACEPGAAISVDGRPVGVAPLLEEVFVEKGAHRVEARLPGFAPAALSIQAAEGETRVLSLRLEKREPARASQPQPLAPSPAPAPDPPRSHALWPVIAGGSAAVVGVSVGVGLLGAAASERESARAGVPGIRNGMTQSCASDAAFAPCAEYTKKEKAGQDYDRVAAASFAVAGVAAVVTVAYLLLPNRPARPVIGESGVVVGQW
jgi:hypothetical protein